MTDSGNLDAAALDRLREWGGDKLLRQMVRLFLDNSGARMDQIRAGVDGGDVAQAERGAHSLKSSAANVGAEQVRTISSDIEDAAGQGDMETLRELLPNLESAYAHAISQLEEVEKEVSE